MANRTPIAVTQRDEADVKAAMRAQGSRDRSNLLRRCQSGDRGVGCASAQECPRQPQVFQSTSLIDLDGCILTSGP